MIQTVKGPALHKNLQPRRWSSLYLMFFCPIRVKKGKASSPAATSSSLTSASPELGATLDLELLLAGEKLRCFGSPQGFPGLPEPHFILQQLPSGLRGSAAADRRSEGQVQGAAAGESWPGEPLCPITNLPISPTLIPPRAMVQNLLVVL